MSKHPEPRTAEEYIERVQQEARQMESEHVPSHKELISHYRSERSYYETKFRQSIGIAVVLILAFLAVKILSASSAHEEA